MPDTPPKTVPEAKDEGEEVLDEVRRALMDHELDQPGTTTVIRSKRRIRRIVRPPFGSQP